MAKLLVLAAAVLVALAAADYVNVTQCTGSQCGGVCSNSILQANFNCDNAPLYGGNMQLNCDPEQRACARTSWYSDQYCTQQIFTSAPVCDGCHFFNGGQGGRGPNGQAFNFKIACVKRNNAPFIDVQHCLFGCNACFPSMTRVALGTCAAHVDPFTGQVIAFLKYDGAFVCSSVDQVIYPPQDAECAGPPQAFLQVAEGVCFNTTTISCTFQ